MQREGALYVYYSTLHIAFQYSNKFYINGRMYTYNNRCCGWMFVWVCKVIQSTFIYTCIICTCMITLTYYSHAYSVLYYFVRLLQLSLISEDSTPRK